MTSKRSNLVPLVALTAITATTCLAYYFLQKKKADESASKPPNDKPRENETTTGKPQENLASKAEEKASTENSGSNAASTEEKAAPTGTTASVAAPREAATLIQKEPTLESASKLDANDKAKNDLGSVPTKPTNDLPPAAGDPKPDKEISPEAPVAPPKLDEIVQETPPVESSTPGQKEEQTSSPIEPTKTQPVPAPSEVETQESKSEEKQSKESPVSKPPKAEPVEPTGNDQPATVDTGSASETTLAPQPTIETNAPPANDTAEQDIAPTPNKDNDNTLPDDAALTPTDAENEDSAPDETSASEPPKTGEEKKADSELWDYLEKEINQARKCAGCDKEEGSEAFKPCAKCRSALYCGRACQKKHWKKHKKVCCK